MSTKLFILFFKKNKIKLNNLFIQFEIIIIFKNKTKKKKELSFYIKRIIIIIKKKKELSFYIKRIIIIIMRNKNKNKTQYL